MTDTQCSNNSHFDVIIIGSGPGGEGAAMGLTKAGFNVAIIEREDSVGGGCTHWGTIPSKALRHAVSRIIEFNHYMLCYQISVFKEYTRKIFIIQGVLFKEASLFFILLPLRNP